MRVLFFFGFYDDECVKLYILDLKKLSMRNNFSDIFFDLWIYLVY